MDDFPLDIPYGEISQWLASRRKLPNDWMKRLRDVQTQTAKAFKSLPAAFASRFDIEEDNWVGYLTAKGIRDAMAETADRGYFGGLSGEAGAWDKLVKGYEKSHIYLGEAGQRILKNIDYEIPFVKKRMEGLEKRALELTRRRSELQSMAVLAAGNYVKECGQLGISGRDLRTELEALGETVFQAVEEGAIGLKGQEMQEAMEYYSNMRSEVHGIEGPTLTVFQKLIDDDIDPPEQPMTAKETERMHRPIESIEEKGQAEDGGGLEIDWDFDVAVAEASIEDDVTAAPIEWDDGDIDWDIAVEQPDSESTEREKASSQPLSLSPGEGGRTAQASAVTEVSAAALRFVWDPQFRNALLDDLYELQAFLIVRSMADVSDAVSLANGDIMHKYDPQSASRFLKRLESVLECFVGEDVRRRLMIKTSKGYLDRLLADLTRSGKREQKWKDAAVQVEQEKSSVQTERSQLNVRLGKIKRETSELKTLVEKDISPLFGNREINVMGKINVVLTE